MNNKELNPDDMWINLELITRKMVEFVEDTITIILSMKGLNQNRHHPACKTEDQDLCLVCSKCGAKESLYNFACRIGNKED